MLLKGLSGGKEQDGHRSQICDARRVRHLVDWLPGPGFLSGTSADVYGPEGLMSFTQAHG
jgi:hypothetical protein